MQFLGGELGRLGLGRVRLPDWLTQDNDEWPRLWGSGNHQLGTTRMAADPKQGVVNADCRVHSVENLYIAGSSVFPTGGYTHPTLTVGAMALRLADHLKSLMQSWHNIRIDAR
jgi:choline dehydrogenase-like flavoprotein